MSDWLKDRIRVTLTIYPGISVSMLQLSLGVPAVEWKPVLQELIAEKHVREDIIVAESAGHKLKHYSKLYWSA
jgi:hypothetical protein